MRVILKIYYSPNSINLWIRVKNALKKKYITDIRGCKFNINSDYTKHMLINDIKKIHAERFNTEIYEEID
jgi:hypothetical protein